MLLNHLLIINIIKMSLKKYPACDQSHYPDIQFVCLREKRVFCMRCWHKCQHYRFCQSTRCGQYSKIAHLVLNRALEYKNSKILESMASSNQSYQNLLVRFLQLNFQISEIVTDFVKQKVPLLLWSMMNELLKSKANPSDINNYNKFDGVCSDMIKIIKANDQKSRHQYLESTIGAYYDINHQIQGELHQLKNGGGFTRQNHKEKQVGDVMEKIKGQLSGMLNNIKKGIRKSIDEELDKATKILDPTCKYSGVAFQKQPSEGESYRKREEYPYLNIIAQQYGKVTSEQNDLYNGFNLNLSQLQTSSDQLLQVSKCFIKDRLFSIYQNIKTLKSVFPYKFAYPIATTLTKDRQYEQLMLDMEKAIIDSPDKTNPLISSLTVLVMGRDLIVIKFFNHPKFSYSRKIYNYSKDRQPYYNTVIDKFGLRGISLKNNATPDNIEYSEELTDIQLVYCNFRIAFESIFIATQQQLVFEGERVMANRGAQQFVRLIENWRNTAEIDLTFSNSMANMTKFFL